MFNKDDGDDNDDDDLHDRALQCHEYEAVIIINIHTAVTKFTCILCIITPKVFLKEVKCLRILRWRDQQVSSSAARLYVLGEELMNKLTSKVQ
jgi:hypothetical protein